VDDIRKRLEQIDRELAGPDVGGRLAGSSPLVLPAVGLIAGIILAKRTSVPLWVWLGVCGAAAVAAGAVFIAQRRSPRPLILACIAGIGFAGLGAVRHLSHQQPPGTDISRLVGDRPMPVSIRGLVITEPRINRYPNWAFSRFKPTSPPASCYLAVTEIEGRDGWASVAGVVRVQMSQAALDVRAGDRIQTYCILGRFSPPGNPGQFDTAAYMARRGVYVAASIDSADGIEKLPAGRQGGFLRFRWRLRRLAANALLGDQDMENPSVGLLQALLLGYRADIDGRTYEAFRRTGLLHFVSLSGLHMAVVIGAVWWLCKTAGLLHRGRAVVCLAAIVLFVMVVPSRAPTLRAAVIAAVFCSAMLFRRRPDAFNTLALAAIILLLVRPSQLYEAGWQLSFSTVLGILLFADRVGGALHRSVGQWLRPDDSRAGRWAVRFARGLTARALMLLAVGISAWLGGVGVMLYHLHAITPLMAVWTVLVFPLVAVTLVGGFIKMLLAGLLPTVAMALGTVLNGVVRLMILFVKAFASVDVLDIGTGRVPGLVIVWLYVCIGVIGFARLRPVLKRALVAVLLVSLVAMIGLVKYGNTFRSDLVVTCLDVAHGQAILIQPPGRANILFDGGSLHRGDPGGQIVNPALDYLGVTRLDAAVVSHSDVDHLNGLVEVAQRFPIDRVYVGREFLDKAGIWGAAMYLTEQLGRMKIPIEPAPRRLYEDPRCRISILWPLDEDTNALSENNRSLVCLIESAGRRVLICSDIEEAAQRRIIELYPDLRADVVVTPHHKADFASGGGFLEHLGGPVFIRSGGRAPFEKPRVSPEGTVLMHTADRGAVTVRINREGRITKTGFARG